METPCPVRCWPPCRVTLQRRPTITSHHLPVYCNTIATATRLQWVIPPVCCLQYFILVQKSDPLQLNSQERSEPPSGHPQYGLYECHSHPHVCIPFGSSTALISFRPLFSKAMSLWSLSSMKNQSWQQPTAIVISLVLNFPLFNALSFRLCSRFIIGNIHHFFLDRNVPLEISGHK